MSDNPNEPHPFDAVLGGQSPQPVNAAVLGGLAGVKHRLASTSDEVRIAALSDALKYGQAGLDIVVEIVKTQTGAMQCAAWNLLRNTTGKTAKQLLKHLSTFTFDVITVNHRGKKISGIPSSASFFPEHLGDGIILDMVSIPGGTFLMGSPETEIGRDDSEGPLHEVTIQPFFMGKYPVTIAQWNAVVALPQINISLNRYCFDFFYNYPRSVNQPVYRSWHEVMEFCARLSKKTGKIYRLPSEAEWEYACRARTTTPFHFGETITTKVANYWRNYKRWRGSKSIIVIDIIYTDVGSFPPNAFGLYDMHGNIKQWCADPWHENYHGAPSDGSVWESGGNTEYRVLRGSDCTSTPQKCRSAYREKSAYTADYRGGFRVVCSSAWNP